MRRRIVVHAVAALAFWLAMRLAVRGALPSWAAVVVVPAAFLALVHRDRLLVAGTVIGLPTLGLGGLVDPWETHYAEVAREMLVRRDFLSPWWANEGWFTTKPVLTFWLEAASMWLFGARTGPDEVLADHAHPEWAVRFPHFAIALVGAYLLADGVGRVCGKRAGFFTAIALWTMPGFALLSHQAMTDMPLVGGVAASLGLLLRALTTDEAEVSPWAGRLLAAAVVAVVLPQLVVILVTPHRLVAGDPFTCGLPSHPDCAVTAVAHARLRPLLQALLWLAPSAWLVLRALEETRVTRLCALAAWGAAAFAAMAKGPAGLVIPAAGVVTVLATQRPGRILDSLRRLEIGPGLVLAVVMIAPWYLAIYARHGRGFLDELVLRHMLGRTMSHLHDTNDGEDVGLVYFVRQIGYATFPWCGLLPFAFMQHTSRCAPRALARTLVFGAGLAAFALVSAMRTKFHHYMLITLPPFAALAGMWLAERPRPRDRWLVVVSIGAAALIYFVGRDLEASPARFVWMLTYRYARLWPSTHAFGAALGVVTGAAIVASLARARAALAVVAAITSMMLVDLYLVRCASDGGQRELLAAYYDQRGEARSPLIAYQLNWKGENFYTGNRVAIFVRSGAPLRAYLEKLRGRGEREFYFATERVRLEILRHELGARATVTEVSSNAEFIVARATY